MTCQSSMVTQIPGKILGRPSTTSFISISPSPDCHCQPLRLRRQPHEPRGVIDKLARQARILQSIVYSYLSPNHPTFAPFYRYLFISISIPISLMSSATLLLLLFPFLQFHLGLHPRCHPASTAIPNDVDALQVEDGGARQVWEAD
jgi:hypothetical protein